MIEERDVQPEAARGVRNEHLARQIVGGGRVPPSRHAHHLVLVAREHVEAQEVRRCRVELPEGVRQLDALEHAQVSSAAMRQQHRRVLARPIDRHDRGVVERRAIVGARGVTDVVIDVVELEVRSAELGADPPRHVEHRKVVAADLLRAALGARFEELSPLRRDADCVHHAVVHVPGLPVVCDVVDVTDGDACLVETVRDRAKREPAVVLLS
jgi:hypothetical protein